MSVYLPPRKTTTCIVDYMKEGDDYFCFCHTTTTETFLNGFIYNLSTVLIIGISSKIARVS